MIRSTTAESFPILPAEVFRRNLQALLRQRGLSPTEFCRRAKLETYIVHRWLRHGVGRPKIDHLARAASTLGLTDPYSLFDSDLLTRSTQALVNPSHTVDRRTNPAVDEVARQRPELFADFHPVDWEEIYGTHGTGGPLTPGGVEASAERINAKRALRRKFEALLETEHFETLASLIELMYRDCAVG